MGLDITAYTRMRKAKDGEVALDADGYPTEWDRWHSVSPAIVDFSNGFGQLQALDVEPGIYAFEDSYGFRAGSYSGYGLWRNDLAQLAGWASAQEVWDLVKDGAAKGPFLALINFADNEGVIGPATAAALAADFAHFEKKAALWAAERGGRDGGWFIEVYRDWKRAFEMAADHGMVAFH